MKRCYIIMYIINSLVYFHILHANEPYAPDFSLSTHVLGEPPPLPQVYGIELPDVLDYYLQSENQGLRNIFLPDAPMLMEICVIGNTSYYYPTKEDVMAGCYRGDDGLSLLTLQPYQYWSILTTLRDVQLMPNNLQVPNTPRIIINYKNMTEPQIVLMNIELGEFDNPMSYIAINGQIFQYNRDVMQIFYGLIYEIQDRMYLLEK